VYAALKELPYGVTPCEVFSAGTKYSYRRVLPGPPRASMNGPVLGQRCTGARRGCQGCSLSILAGLRAVRKHARGCRLVC